MNSNRAEVPLHVVLITFFIVVLTISLGYLFKKELQLYVIDGASLFCTDRLDRVNGENGMVVIGSSLIQCGFPFDSDMELAARKRNMDISFVRFFKHGNTTYGFEKLLNDVLKHPPRWLFLQAETFFIGSRFNRVPSIDNRLRTATEDLVSRVNAVVDTLYRAAIVRLNFFHDSDSTSSTCIHQFDLPEHNMLKEAKRNDILEEEYTFFIHPPAFPRYVEKFLEKSERIGIKVFLLEMNRSDEANQASVENFREKLTSTFEEVSTRYRIPYWQFPSNIPLDHYQDQAHLNYKGREKFTDWFLNKFSRIYQYERL